MATEAITGIERLEKAIRLEPVDRIPVLPLIGQFAQRHKGLPVLPAGAGTPEDWSNAVQAAHDTLADLGGCDGVYVAGVNWPISSWRVSGAGGGRSIAPGQDNIPDDFALQYEERETIFPEDYDTIASLGWNGFLEQYIPKTLGVSLEQADLAQKTLLELYRADTVSWNNQGVDVMSGALIISCEMTLSLARTLPKFMLDLHRQPERVIAAMEAMVPDFVANAVTDCKASGIPQVVISMERGSGAYHSLAQYERFFFPSLKRIVEALAKENIISVMHMDTDWTRNLPYFKDLPEKMCVCEVDSITDIFKAKEILGGHMCIMGDVPASLLSLGTEEEVITYCKKLIDIVGKDGGFILSSGCEVPVDAKFENVKAMIDTAKTYNPH